MARHAHRFDAPFRHGVQRRSVWLALPELGSPRAGRFCRRRLGNGSRKPLVETAFLANNTQGTGSTFRERVPLFLSSSLILIRLLITEEGFAIRCPAGGFLRRATFASNVVAGTGRNARTAAVSLHYSTVAQQPRFTDWIKQNQYIHVVLACLS